MKSVIEIKFCPCSYADFVRSVFVVILLFPERQPHPAPPSRHRPASCSYISIEAFMAEDGRSNILLARLSTAPVREQGELCRCRCGPGPPSLKIKLALIP